MIRIKKDLTGTGWENMDRTDLVQGGDTWLGRGHVPRAGTRA